MCHIVSLTYVAYVWEIVSEALGIETRKVRVSRVKKLTYMSARERERRER